MLGGLALLDAVRYCLRFRSSLIGESEHNVSSSVQGEKAIVVQFDNYMEHKCESE